MFILKLKGYLKDPHIFLLSLFSDIYRMDKSEKLNSNEAYFCIYQCLREEFAAVATMRLTSITPTQLKIKHSLGVFKSHYCTFYDIQVIENLG